MRGMKFIPLIAILLALCGVPAVATDVYRWVDAEGGVHYGNHPADDATLLFRTSTVKPSVAADGAPRQTVGVARVIDGDTVVLASGEHVRVIGINAPEIANAGKPGQEGGQAAKDRLAALVKDQRLGLEDGVEPLDHYGRRLGSLFDVDGKDLAVVLLNEGLVAAVPHPPNVRHADAYLAAEAVARKARLGIWALPDYAVVTPADLRDAGNRFRRVRVIVAGITREGKDEVLRDASGFELRIPREAAGDFPPLSQLLGRSLVARGFVKHRGDTNYLLLVHHSEIEPADAGGE